MNNVDPGCCHCDHNERNLRLLPFHIVICIFTYLFYIFIYLLAYLSPTCVQNVSKTSFFDTRFKVQGFHSCHCRRVAAPFVCPSEQQ